MISIIIPLYNKRKTIVKTLRSIFNQTYRALEIIIVDDGSIDEGVAKAEKFNDKVKIIKGLGHHGANWARNYGAHSASGKYLFFCDADIVLRPDALEKMKNALDENPNASFAYCSFRLGWKKMSSRPFDAEKLKKYNYISTMSLIRREDFPGFDENLEKFQDWDLWLTMLERGKKGIFVPEALFSVKVSRASQSHWRPRFFYQIPWKRFGLKFKAIEKYENALKKIKKKHKI